MTDPIELDLDAIEVLATKAAPGPWLAKHHGSVILELIRRLRIAEANASSKIEVIPRDTEVFAIFTELPRHIVPDAKAFAEAIRARCGPQTTVIFLPPDSSIKGMNEADMRQAGWVRAPIPETT